MILISNVSKAVRLHEVVAAFADSSRWLQAISVLTEVIMLNPCLPDTYHTLGLVYDTIGNAEKAAVRADPSDITLRFHLASLYVQLRDYQRAAESCKEIVQLCPENVEALKTGAKLYLKSGQIESSVGILEDYFKSHPSETDSNSAIIDLLASVFMETNAYDKALQHIEHSHLVYYSGEKAAFEFENQSWDLSHSFQKYGEVRVLQEVGRAQFEKDSLSPNCAKEKAI
ncbi:hypothetical protein Dsin_014144 [Dipteronia sinensis]|uniref:Uncharacterized protein n=1 Tax=Dipteronia sinensis TaxID=43782 RepID=A0AAE0AMI2_9ROSI|nr:hypothetical protein Dsin_014144 [Dipteronia sinensis]